MLLRNLKPGIRRHGRGLRDIQTTEKIKTSAVALQSKPQQAVAVSTSSALLLRLSVAIANMHKIIEIDPAKARALRAICNAELKTLPNKGAIELPAPSNDLKEIRVALKQRKATRGCGR